LKPQSLKASTIDVDVVVVVEARPRRSAVGQCSTWGTGAFSMPYRPIAALDSSRAGGKGLPALQMR